MPATMNASRMKTAPRMPQNSTRYWYICGNVEESKDHDEHEDVVHRQRFFDEEGGQEDPPRLVPPHHQTTALNTSPRLIQKTVHRADSLSEGTWSWR